MYFLCAVLSLAVMVDLIRYKIPNWLLLMGYLGGIVYQYRSSNLWYFYVTDSILILITFYILFYFNILGGGDVKLYAVIALFVGYIPCLNIFVLSFIVGALISVFKIAFLVISQKEWDISHLYIHFSLPILIGTILTHFGGISWITF